MGTRAVAALLACGMASACGGSRPEAISRSSSGAGHGPGSAADAAPAAADAGPVRWPDAGPPDEPLEVADAGMADIGVAECEALLARLVACSGLPPEEKRLAVEENRRLREAAATSTPEERADLAAGCRSMARSVGEALLAIGC